MSVNVKDTSYRRVDVDALNPEQYIEVEQPYDASFGDASGPNEQAVKSLLQSNRLNDALVESLKNPPLRSTDNVISTLYDSFYFPFLGVARKRVSVAFEGPNQLQSK
jgi:hypothetical protein